jgi:Na+/proline symporter
MAAATIDPTLETADMAFIVVMEKYFPPVICGFLAASLFAAIMSSVDSFLLSCSSTIARDIYKGLINPQADEKKIIRLGVISLWVVGIIVIAFSMLNLPLISIISGMAAAGCISAFAAPLVIGLYWKDISRNGVFWSMLVGIVVYVVLNRWAAYPAMAEILITVPVSAIVCFVVSKISPNKNKA